MYDQASGNWVPTDGHDYKFMLDSKLDNEVKEIEEAEIVETPEPGTFGDEFDPIVTGEEE